MKTQTLGLGVFLLLAATGCGSSGGDDPAPLVEETFRNPPELRSANGELRTALSVAATPLELAGKTVTTTVYNGAYTPPVLRLRPGDTLFLDIENRVSEQTNLHLHGLNVSPRINADATVSDNVFVGVDPGMNLSYRVAIPEAHNPGLYWYHTHTHERSQRQVMGGMSGGLVIDGILDPFPALQNVVERILLLKDIQISDDGTVPEEIDPGAPTNRLVNGQVNPTITIRPNETQFFRIANVGSDLYYQLRLDGHVFHEIARDGNRGNVVIARNELLLPPSSRAEVFIQAGAPGSYQLRAHAFDTGPAGDSYDGATIATLVAQGKPDVLIPLPRALPAVEDFRTLPVARHRTITFTESDDGNSFFIDSGDGPKPFDPNRVDSTIDSGTVEEWTIVNTTQELHTFHIHQTDFQVTEINGIPQSFFGHQDNVSVPFQAEGSGAPGRVKLLIDFRNPVITGKFVYHCHILEHEDAGMMAVAEVAPPLQSTLSRVADHFIKVVNQVVPTKASDEQRARIEETLNAIQAGSFCRSAPAQASTPPAPAQALVLAPAAGSEAVSAAQP